MNKRLFFVFICAIFIPTNFVFATVGGNQYFTDFQYFSSKNSVHFLHHDTSGAGCDPALSSISLITGDITTKYACSERMKSDELNSKYEEEKKTWLKDGKVLKEVDLSKIDLEFTSKFYSGDFSKESEYDDTYFGQMLVDSGSLYHNDYIFNWRIKAFYNDLPVSKFIITTCPQEKDVNFSVLSYPGANFLLIVATTINLCYETFYPTDSVYLISDVRLPKDVFLSDYTLPSYSEEIKQSSQKIYHELDVKDGLEILNTMGFDFYQQKKYAKAIYYFYTSYTDEYLLPLYNLSATQAIIGKRDHAFENIKLLLQKDSNTLYWINKLNVDPDFDTLREDERYMQIVTTTNANINDNQDDETAETMPDEKQNLVEQKSQVQEDESLLSKLIIPFIPVALLTMIVVVSILVIKIKK